MIKDSELTNKIIQCIIKVHSALGPGFLESIYRRSLVIEMQNNEIQVEEEKEIPVYYFKQLVGIHRIDIMVENKIILELKTVEKLGKVHYSQLRSYLKAANLNIGLLVNFTDLKADFRRVEIES